MCVSCVGGVSKGGGFSGACCVVASCDWTPPLLPYKEGGGGERQV